MKATSLSDLQCRIKHATSVKLHSWSDEVGLSLGEVIDLLVENYEDLCRSQKGGFVIDDAEA